MLVDGYNWKDISLQPEFMTCSKWQILNDSPELLFIQHKMGLFMKHYFVCAAGKGCFLIVAGRKPLELAWLFQASHCSCSGFLLLVALLLQEAQALGGRRLRSVARMGLDCFTSCGIFPDQGPNPMSTQVGRWVLKQWTTRQGPPSTSV